MKHKQGCVCGGRGRNCEYLLPPVRPESGTEAPAFTGRTDRSAGGLNGRRGNGEVGDWVVKCNDVVLGSNGEGNDVVEAWLEQ